MSRTRASPIFSVARNAPPNLSALLAMLPLTCQIGAQPKKFGRRIPSLFEVQVRECLIIACTQSDFIDPWLAARRCLARSKGMPGLLALKQCALHQPDSQDLAAMEAARVARQVVGLPPALYMPHLSLLYAELPERDRQAVAAAAHAMLFEEGGGGLEEVRKPFVVDRVHLWETPSGNTSSWCRVAEFELVEQL